MRADRKRTLTFLFSISSIALLVLLVAAAVPVMFMGPHAIPAKRIIANLQKQLKEKPKDHHVIYTLARVHYLSMVNQSALIPAYGRGDSARPAPRHIADGFLSNVRYEEAAKRARKAMGLKKGEEYGKTKIKEFRSRQSKEYKKLEKAKWIPEPLDKKTLLEYARTSMGLFDRAINLAPKNPLYQLGRASLGEQVMQLHEAKKLEALLPGLSVEAIRKLYLATFELAIVKDLKTGMVPVAGMSDLVSYESGHAYLRLTKNKTKLADKDKEQVAAVKKGLGRLRKELTPGPVTPILIGRTPDTRLSDLLSPTGEVFFDLDGDGVREHWPWVKPDTGILVWAPPGTKAIESGRQLFGSVTFFLFHRDGYEALRLLDDNRDGELTGMELYGLAIWYDRDGDGRSTPTELVSAWDADVEAIVTRADDHDGRAPKSSYGLRYADGRVVPTIDWITERIQ